ncbi:DUF397 domain-containing protein [Actinomadura macrotermitis]|nr:DUF397 domain-containing protein [Actinomadura macrotermitis]
MWRRSSHSTDTGGNCIEVAILFDAVAIRDSKDVDGGRLTLHAESFRAFLDSVKRSYP